MPAFVYILRNQQSGRHYIGSTQDLQRRLADHQRGNTRSTRAQGPWILLYSEQLPDLASARRREREIKRYKGGLKFKALVGRAGSRLEGEA